MHHKTWLAELNHYQLLRTIGMSGAIKRLERSEQSRQRFSIGSNPLLVIVLAASGEAWILIIA